MGVELPLRVVVTILECCVTFSGVKLSIRSFVLLLRLGLGLGQTDFRGTVIRLVGLQTVTLSDIIRKRYGCQHVLMLMTENWLSR